MLLCRVRYKLSYWDVAELFLLRGFDFTHETVQDWEERFAPLFAQGLRAKHQGKAGKVWYVDETYRYRWRIPGIEIKGLLGLRSLVPAGDTAMSLKPTMIEPVPASTVQVARAAFPRGNVYLTLRDELGTLFRDEAFADLFPAGGQPALPP